MANVGLTDLIQIFLVTPRGGMLHQIVPPPSSLMRNPIELTALTAFLALIALIALKVLEASTVLETLLAKM